MRGLEGEQKGWLGDACRERPSLCDQFKAVESGPAGAKVAAMRAQALPQTPLASESAPPSWHVGC